MTAPGRPQYLDVPYSRDDIKNGVPLPPMKGSNPAPVSTPTPQPAPEPDELLDFRAKMRSGPVRAADAPQLPIRPPEEKPVSPETTDALLKAVAKVHRVLTDRIRYHETEAARLKASLAPFATLAPTGAPPPQSDTINQLLDFVKGLPDPPEAPS